MFRLALLLLCACLAGGCDEVRQLMAPLPPRPAPPPAPAEPPAPAPPAPPPAPLDPAVEAGLSRARLSIERNLESSLAPFVEPDLASPLSQVIARLLVWWIAFPQDLRNGDQLEVIYEPVPGEEPRIHALSYFSVKNDRRYAAYRHQPPGAPFARYFDPDGQEVEARLLGGPIEDYEQITARLGDGRGHRGVDFRAPVGTPVTAPFAGKVVRRNWNGRVNGNSVEIQDAAGRKLGFLHLAQIAEGMRPGNRVRAGQRIGTSGNTGRSFAPHLHYQIESRSGRVLDPFRVHETYRRRLSEGQIAAFQEARDRYDEMLAFQPADVAAAEVPAADARGPRPVDSPELAPSAPETAAGAPEPEAGLVDLTGGAAGAPAPGGQAEPGGEPGASPSPQDPPAGMAPEPDRARPRVPPELMRARQIIDAGLGSAPPR